MPPRSSVSNQEIMIALQDVTKNVAVLTERVERQSDAVSDQLKSQTREIESRLVSMSTLTSRESNVVGEKLAEDRRQLADLTGRVTALANSVDVLRSEQTALHAKIIQNGTGDYLVKVDERVKKLEQTDLKREGASQLAKILFSIFGVALGAVILAVLKLAFS